MIEKFNIRVYGLLLNDNSELLVADEFEFGMKFTKFPGGGLELGEGLIDGLKREWMEELGQEIEVVEHFYTTDFFSYLVFIPINNLSAFIIWLNQFLILKFPSAPNLLILLRRKERCFRSDG